MPEAGKLTDKDRLDAAMKLIHGVHEEPDRSRDDALGQFWYQNMNFGLCRILISTITARSRRAGYSGARGAVHVQRRPVGPDHALGLPGLRPRERVRALRGDPPQSLFWLVADAHASNVVLVRPVHR